MYSIHMRRKILIIFTTAYLVFLVLAAFVLLLPSPYSCTYLSQLNVKMERLRQAEGKRIILVGGSAVPFGVDSSVLEYEFGHGDKSPETPGRLRDYEIVDMGLYGSIGSKVTLSLIRPYIRKGDIVVVLPEQQSDTLNGYFEGKYLWQALDMKAFRFLFALEADDRTALMDRFLPYLGEKIRLLVNGDDLTPVEGDIYSPDSFNEQGDIEALRAGNIMPGGYDPDNRISFDKGQLKGELFSYLNSFESYARKRGAVLLLGYGPMNEPAFIEGEDAGVYENALRGMMKCDVIGTASEASLDSSFFYDTNYHLNSEGAAVYTYYLVRWIKGAMGDVSYTRLPEFETEAMEDAFDSDAGTGDRRSEAGFDYEENDNGIRILAVSEESRDLEEITIPDEIAGKEVVALSDHMFNGCDRLKRIIIMQEIPSKLRVGRNLLTGTDAKILVPEGSLSRYRTNYFWSTYA